MRTLPDMGFENAALRQVSMYVSSNPSSPRFPPRREPFQSTANHEWEIQRQHIPP